MKSFLGLNSSGDIPDLTSPEISESRTKYDIFTKKLWNDMSKIIQPLKQLHVLVNSLNKIDNAHGYFIFVVCKILKGI